MSEMARARHDQIAETALEWHRTGRGAALATVVETWGSAPRQPGSLLVIDAEGRIMGSVSGGCVEGAVITEAQDALADGQSRVLTFGVSDETAFSVGLACGGTIRVLVEPVGAGIPEQMLADLVAARATRQPRAYQVNLQSWERRLTDGSDVAARMRSDKSGMEDGDWFVAIHNPALRMAVVGAVHIAQPLCQIARACGYDVTLIDPRGAFASAERFPGEHILDDWPDEALAALGLDARTAVVTLTHDAKLDDPAIRAALESDCFYLGCLGSARTHAKRVERLTAAGFADRIGRIHAPVGLDIGAKTPAEIAVSVMAQVTQVLRQG
ncbi:MAG: XdhC family protein [Gemmobacter sp.]